ncbi:MAG: hypothetical protein IT258_08065 [Saprospiraceae bacterium]|nr:hypothetical protein [Saprospiraceae bacterium]
MKNYSLLFIALFSSFYLAAQSPFQAQLALPVHFVKKGETPTQIAQHSTKTYLSGIALLFLDTASMADELIVTGSTDLVVWHEYIGKSTKVTFYIPDSSFIGKFEMTYYDEKCKVDISLLDRNTGEEAHAEGEFQVYKNNEYALQVHAEGDAVARISRIFHPLNTYLMQLHNRNLRRVAMKSWFQKDSINVIVGADSQFDTNYDLFWLGQSFRNRISSMASNAYSKLFLFNNRASVIKDSFAMDGRMVLHCAERKGKSIKGTLSIRFKPDNQVRYVFLKPYNEYKAEFSYSFVYNKNGQNELNIERFALRNLQTGDFVDMDIYDFVNYSLPVMYVDLIRGVVTGTDAWDITNVVHAIEDVVASSQLPYE